MHRDRSTFQKDIAKDKSKLEAFLKRREGVIARTRSSLDSKAKRAGGMKRVSVHTKEFKRRVLEKPSDDFWPLNRYRKRFGSPSRNGNKRLGHKKCVLEGHPGVLVLGDDGLGPWKVRTQEGREIAKEESEDVGSSGGEEDVAEAKFEDLKKADDENYAAVVKGAMSSILQGFELDEEQRKEEDSRIARRQALRKKAKKKMAASSQAKRRKVNARFFESDDEDTAVAAENAEKWLSVRSRGLAPAPPRRNRLERVPPFRRMLELPPSMANKRLAHQTKRLESLGLQRSLLKKWRTSIGASLPGLTSIRCSSPKSRR